jgi:N,N'-diacetyllegionaminate synthase
VKWIIALKESLGKGLEMDKVYIVAEAGVNHNGSLSLAKQLVESAAKAGVDAVKFQTFVAKCGISKNAPKADYQLKLTDHSESQIEMIKRLELSAESHVELIDHCRQQGVDFLSTACDLDSVALLETLDQSAYKIASCDIVNVPVIRAVAKLGKRVFLSTGMATLGEVERAISELEIHGTNDIILLHCTTEYPCPIEEVNLLKIQTLQKAFNLPVGFSDHSEGISAAVASIALGAVIVEKHFTLDRQMEGPDHKASIDPQGMEDLVLSIREVEQALGNAKFVPSQSEQRNLQIMRRKIVAAKDIKVGDVFNLENVGFKRAEGGITPDYCDFILGKKAVTDYSTDDVIIF